MKRRSFMTAVATAAPVLTLTVWLARRWRSGKEQLMAEDTFVDPVLGRLVYEREFDRWEGQVELRPHLGVEFNLSASTGTDLKIDLNELVRKGVVYLEWARSAEVSIRQRIADELLDTYNDNWADENDGTAKLSRGEFVERICASSIELDADGESTWYYEDGDLFAGHWIEVRLDSDWNIDEVGLAG